MKKTLIIFGSILALMLTIFFVAPTRTQPPTTPTTTPTPIVTAPEPSLPTPNNLTLKPTPTKSDTTIFAVYDHSSLEIDRNQFVRMSDEVIKYVDVSIGSPLFTSGAWVDVGSSGIVKEFRDRGVALDDVHYMIIESLDPTVPQDATSLMGLALLYDTFLPYGEDDTVRVGAAKDCASSVALFACLSESVAYSNLQVERLAPDPDSTSPDPAVPAPSPQIFRLMFDVNTILQVVSEDNVIKDINIKYVYKIDYNLDSNLIVGLENTFTLST